MRTGEIEPRGPESRPIRQKATRNRREHRQRAQHKARKNGGSRQTHIAESTGSTKKKPNAIYVNVKKERRGLRKRKRAERVRSHSIGHVFSARCCVVARRTAAGRPPPWESIWVSSPRDPGREGMILLLCHRSAGPMVRANRRDTRESQPLTPRTLQ